MAKIADSKGRGDENSGYGRLFGDILLGHLISKVQATVIRTGNELENILRDQTDDAMKTNLEEAITYRGGAFHIAKQVVFRPIMPATDGKAGVFGDIAVFDHQNRTAMVIELKDGDTFDTKKASGELESMTKLSKWISQRTGYSTNIYFCSFNQADKQAIVNGAKRRFSINNAMTGRELCEILGLDYDTVREFRRRAQKENLAYFLKGLVDIPEIKEILVSLISK